MPYVITEKRPTGGATPLVQGAYTQQAAPVTSRRAVATLEEVHQAISDARVRACNPAELAVFDFDDETLPSESGGTVKLLDGAIEVERVSDVRAVKWLREHGYSPTSPWDAREKFPAAFNAQEVSA